MEKIKIKIADLIPLIESTSWNDQFRDFNIQRTINLLINLDLIKTENIDFETDYRFDLYDEPESIE